VFGAIHTLLAGGTVHLLLVRDSGTRSVHCSPLFHKALQHAIHSVARDELRHIATQHSQQATLHLLLLLKSTSGSASSLSAASGSISTDIWLFLVLRLGLLGAPPAASTSLTTLHSHFSACTWKRVREWPEGLGWTTIFERNIGLTDSALRNVCSAAVGGTHLPLEPQQLLVQRPLQLLVVCLLWG
jgi:hypothetical protein